MRDNEYGDNVGDAIVPYALKWLSKKNIDKSSTIRFSLVGENIAN